MEYLFPILIVITCILLVLVVLVQNPKGGGLSAAFGGGNQVMGVKKTADFLEKATWYLAIALLVLSLFSNVISFRGDNTNGDQSIAKEQIENATIPTQAIPDLPQIETLEE
jgi:preprotein translocase subunit SecG|tara:strand:- start:5035 stop:5367 length:333 start_codon:yes stop_codon:yes gene_type:complete